jgi:hypothetical protein
MIKSCAKCKHSETVAIGWTCKCDLDKMDNPLCLMKKQVLYLNGIQQIFRGIQKAQDEAMKEWYKHTNKPLPGDEWKGNDAKE